MWRARTPEDNYKDATKGAAQTAKENCAHPGRLQGRLDALEQVAAREVLVVGVRRRGPGPQRFQPGPDASPSEAALLSWDVFAWLRE